MCLLQNIYRNHVSQWFVPVCVCVWGSEVAQCCVCVLLPVSEVLLNVHSSDVLDMPVDPNEPTYCLCAQVSYGEMIGCDNADVYTHTHSLHTLHTTHTQSAHTTHTAHTQFIYTLHTRYTFFTHYTYFTHALYTLSDFFTHSLPHILYMLYTVYTLHTLHTLEVSVQSPCTLIHFPLISVT